MIRAATPADAAAICGIWNPVIRDSLATFNATEKTPADIAQMIADKAAAGHAFLVAEVDQQRVGFGYLAQFRGGIGYRHSAEHTIYISAGAQGQGTGRALMDALCDHARAAAFHSLWAGVSAANPAAVQFHQRMGFKQVATLKEVGRKFDRWLDLILLQKML